jgi:CheY-like chemotaxis protein
VRILLVDDDSPSVEALRELLEYEGYQVVCAPNGLEALQTLRQSEGYCLILLDLMMPVLDGYGFRREQLKDPKLASIPIIVITAGGRVAEQTRELGSDVYFRKPLSPPELLSAIRRYCCEGESPNRRTGSY